MSSFVSVLVVRCRDRLRLSSFVDPVFQTQKGQHLSNTICRDQVEKIADRCPNDQPGFRSYDQQGNKDVVYVVSCRPDRGLMTVLAVNRLSPSLSGATPTQVQSAACALLTELETEFAGKYAPDVVASASKPFQMIKFEMQLAKLFQRHHMSCAAKASKTGGWAASPDAAGSSSSSGAPSSSSSGNNNNANATYDALKKELHDVHGVIRANLDDILTRGEKLDSMHQQSAQLKESSKHYYGKTVQMNRMRLLKTYGPPAVIIFFVLLYFWFAYF